MRHKTEDGGLVRGFLHYARRFQTAAITFVEQTVIEGRGLPPRKPYERSIHQVSQPEFLYLPQWMIFRYGKFNMLYGNRKVVQFFVIPGHVEDEPGIHAA